MKCELKRYKISPLADSLPSLRSGVRYAHTATQTPRNKMANAITLLLPTRRFKQENEKKKCTWKINNKIVSLQLFNNCMSL